MSNTTYSIHLRIENKPKAQSTIKNISHSGYEDKSEDHGGSQQQPHSHHSWVGIHIVPQSVGGDNDDSQHNTCDVHRGSNVHRVIQTLHLHIASTESQEQSQDLQNALVSKQNRIEDDLPSRFTDVEKVLVLLSCCLMNKNYS